MYQNYSICRWWLNYGGFIFKLPVECGIAERKYQCIESMKQIEREGELIRYVNSAFTRILFKLIDDFEVPDITCIKKSRTNAWTQK